MLSLTTVARLHFKREGGGFLLMMMSSTMMSYQNHLLKLLQYRGSFILGVFCVLSLLSPLPPSFWVLSITSGPAVEHCSFQKWLFTWDLICTTALVATCAPTLFQYFPKLQIQTINDSYSVDDHRPFLSSTTPVSRETPDSFTVLFQSGRKLSNSISTGGSSVRGSANTITTRGSSGTSGSNGTEFGGWIPTFPNIFTCLGGIISLSTSFFRHVSAVSQHTAWRSASEWWGALVMVTSTTQVGREAMCRVSDAKVDARKGVATWGGLKSTSGWGGV